MEKTIFTSFRSGRFFAAALLFMVFTFYAAQANAQALVNSSFGWGSGVTGGGSASPVTVSTNSAFRSAVSGDNAKVVQISGTIDLGIANMASIGSNTTIIGLGSNARLLHGGVKISGKSNVIIRNISFEDARDPNWECESPTEGGQPSNCTASNAEYDNLVIQSGSSRVWIDHCTFSNHHTTSLAYDGQLDIKNGSDYVTVSYCVFKNGKKTMLVGASDSDTGNYRITYAYNWFQGTESRNPRVRFGQVHMLNNYYSNIGNYGIGLGHNARVYAERNYFYSSKRPSDLITSTGQIRNVGNKFVSCSPNSFEGQVSSVAWSPSYSYTALNVDDVPAHVQANAGVGKINSGGDGGSSTYYQLRNRGTGLFIDGMGLPANGSASGQYANTTHVNAQWEMISTGSYYQFRNRGTGLFLDGMGRTESGADVGQWTGTTHVNSQWSVQQYSGSYYRIQNRGTGLYLDGMGRTTNGAAAGQWPNTTHANAQWELVPVSGSNIAFSNRSEDLKVIESNGKGEVKVYPNPASAVLNISIASESENGVNVKLIDAVGKAVIVSDFAGRNHVLDLKSLGSGFYMLVIEDGTKVIKHKIVKN